MEPCRLFLPLIEQLNTLSSLNKLDKAAHNGKAHWVFSGDIRDVESVSSELEKANLTYRRLDVPCAAHSRYLDSMLDSYASFTHQLTPSLKEESLLIWCNRQNHQFVKRVKRRLLGSSC